MLQKLAEYVATVDRNIARTPQKTTIVVPNESVMKLNSPNGSNGQYSVDELSDQLMTAAVTDGANPPGWPITDFLKQHVLADKNRPKPVTMAALNSGNKNSNPLKRSNSTPRRLSNSTQKQQDPRSNSKTKTPSTQTRAIQAVKTELDDSRDGENGKGSAEETTPSKELFLDNTNEMNLKSPSSDAKLTIPMQESKLFLIYYPLVSIVNLVPLLATSPKPALLKSMSVEDFLNTNPDGTINYDSIVRSNLFQKKVNEVSFSFLIK